MDTTRTVAPSKVEQDIDDDEVWAREEGVPSIDEPFIQKYLDGRDALISQENRQRSDHAFRQTLSPMAAEACAIVADIRSEELQTLWTAEFEDSLAQKKEIDIFRGMMFALAKGRMESSKLFGIIKRMPKGALLHCHLGAMSDFDLLIREALETENMCVSAVAPLSSPSALEEVQFTFRHSSKAGATDVTSLWSDSYIRNELIPVTKAADSFPNGGREGFKKWLKSRMTITEEESLRHHLGPNQIWRKMASCFPIVDSLTHYEPIFRKFVWCMLSQLNEDGVRWVDIRADFVTPFYRTGAEEPDEGFEGFMTALEEIIDEFKNSEEGSGFWGARLIWTSIRIFETRTIIEDMKECIRMKQLFPDLICGYDFVGQEDLGRPLAEMTPEIFWFKKRCVEEGVDIPFFFHAGETLGTGMMLMRTCSMQSCLAQDASVTVLPYTNIHFLLIW